MHVKREITKSESAPKAPSMGNPAPSAEGLQRRKADAKLAEDAMALYWKVRYDAEGSEELKTLIEEKGGKLSHALVPFLGDKENCHKAGSLLEEIGLPAVPALIRALKEKEYDLKHLNVIIALSLIAESMLKEEGGEEKSPPYNWKPASALLFRALRHENAAVRKEAAFAILQIADESSVPALCRALKSESLKNDWNSRILLVDAIWRLAGKGAECSSAIPLLTEALEGEDHSCMPRIYDLVCGGPIHRLKESACAAIGNICKNADPFPTGWDWTRTIRALINAMDAQVASAKPALGEFFFKETEFDWSALDDMVPVLVPIFFEQMFFQLNFPDLVVAARKKEIRLPFPRTAEGMVEHISLSPQAFLCSCALNEETEPGMRIRFIKSLGDHGQFTHALLLLDLLDNKDCHVRSAAQNSIKKICMASVDPYIYWTLWENMLKEAGNSDDPGFEERIWFGMHDMVLRIHALRKKT